MGKPMSKLKKQIGFPHSKEEMSIMMMSIQDTAMRKTDKNVKLIKEFVHETRCSTISDLANEVGILI
jgi:predicted transcriptional regulator